MKWRDGPVSLHLSTHAYYGIPELSYPAVRGYDPEGRERWAYIHRLNSIAWFYDPEKHERLTDVTREMHTHHVDACPLNNAESNLELETEEKHQGRNGGGPSRPWFEFGEVERAIENMEPGSELASMINADADEPAEVTG